MDHVVSIGVIGFLFFMFGLIMVGAAVQARHTKEVRRQRHIAGLKEQAERELDTRWDDNIDAVTPDWALVPWMHTDMVEREHRTRR